jgi:hypothetical protein
MKPKIETKAIIKKDFNQVPVEFRQDSAGDLWLTADQIGKALGYSNPKKAVLNILDRHSDLLSDYKGSINLRTPGGIQPVIVIHEMGVNIICMKANTPVAKQFIKFAAKLIMEFRHGRLQPVQKLPSAALINALRKTYDKAFLQLWLSKKLGITLPPAEIVRTHLETCGLNEFKVMQELKETVSPRFWSNINTGNIDKEKIAAFCGLKVEDIWRLK